MTQTSTSQTCYTCNGSGKAPYDPTLADKVGLLSVHFRCSTCEGSGVSGPKPVWGTKVSEGTWEPVSDDFWDSWGV